MRKLVTMMIFVVFTVSIGLGSFQPADASDYVTFCVKMKKNGDPKKNTKPKRAADGKDPGSPCKSKEKEFTVPTDTITDDLQSQIDDLQSQIDDLDDQINGMDGIADMVQMNKDDISTLQNMVTEIKTELISSVIWGTIGDDTIGAGGSEIMFAGPSGDEISATESDVNQRIAASGIITDMFVRSTNPGVGTDPNTLTVTFQKDGVDTDVTCTITGNAAAVRECSVMDVCAEFSKGALIDVKLDYNEPDTNMGGVTNIRWNARFVENGVCDA